MLLTVGGLCFAAGTRCKEISVLKDNFHVTLSGPRPLLNEAMMISVFLSVESDIVKANSLVEAIKISLRLSKCSEV